MKKYIVPLLVLIALFALTLSAGAAGSTPAAWTASNNSKTVNVVANESLTGNGLIKADGNYVCAGEDDEVTGAKIGTKDLVVFSKLPVAGQSSTVAAILKSDGAPFVVTEAISITVKNGSDTTGVQFTAYNCAGVTLPQKALDLINSYVAPAPKPAALSTAGSSTTLTQWAQSDPTIYQDAKASSITGNYTVTVAGDFAMFGVDDEATSLTLNGKEVLANCTVNVKMQGELLRTIVCPGPFAVNDKLVVKAKDTKGGGSGIYAQSGVNRFAGTYQNWDPAAKALVMTDVMPDAAQAAADAAKLAPKPAADPRLDAMEARQADIEAKLQTLFEQLALIVARLK